MNLFRPQSYNYYHSYANGLGKKKSCNTFSSGFTVCDRVKSFVKNYY